MRSLKNELISVLCPCSENLRCNMVSTGDDLTQLNVKCRCVLATAALLQHFVSNSRQLSDVKTYKGGCAASAKRTSVSTSMYRAQNLGSHDVNMSLDMIGVCMEG